jgi:hypothetical protein
MPAREANRLLAVHESGGGVVSPRTWQRALEALSRISDEARTAIDELTTLITLNQALPRGEHSIQAEERDAVLLSLEIAGLARHRIPFPAGSAAHFLDGIEYSIPEDALIVHDASRMPGFEFVREFPGTALEFRDEASGRSLTIMNVNRRPLETTTGVDLIYYRHEPQAFVLVQYKRLVREGDKWLYRPNADRHLAKEIARMDALKLPTAVAAIPRDFRLSDSPFYIKLCKPPYADQSPERLIAGMYIPLAFWKALHASPDMKGPRGGTAIGYHNLDRWLTNTLFADLVAEAWIGTSGAATEQIAELIRSSLRLGKSAVIALESGPPRQRRGVKRAPSPLS